MQLSRFLQNSVGRDYEVRVAGFHGDLRDIDADYTLDSLLDFYGENALKPIKGKNYQRYLKEIEAFKPDLIISDLEFFTSNAAVELSIPYWIVSSFAFYFAIPKKLKDSLGIAKHYRGVLFNNKSFNRYQFQLANAEQKFVYSFMGDVDNRPDIGDFAWTRPYHIKSDVTKPKAFVAALSNTDKQLIKFITAMGDVKLYSEYSYENVGVQHLDINDRSYAGDVKNSYLVFSSGETSIIADAFYNGKYSLVYPDYLSSESVVNSKLVEYFKLGEKIYTRKSFEQINDLVSKNLSVTISPNKEIKYLHEYVEDMI